jgi:phosphoglycerate dehydrogenase-like enzyme
VLDMMDRRPIWAMPSWVPDELRASLPEAWELVVIEEETEGSGDGATRVSPTVQDAVAGAEIYFGYGIPAELLRAGRRLDWVHSGAAGVGSSLTPAMLASPVVFTNSAGIHAPPMAETVLGMLLYFGRGLDIAVAGQHEARWSNEDYYVAGSPLGELSAATVGIIGYGGIGREVARRVASLGARVVATRRGAPRPADADLEPVAGGGSLASRIDLLTGPDGLDTLLRSSDAVVVCAPDTPETRGMIDAEAIARMKPGAVLVNVARGNLVDETALLRALEDGRLRGAGLDVFAREPLPPDHALWRRPNVLVTPHVSAVTRGYWRRETDLILTNLGRYLLGVPSREWDNVVDKAAGY